MTGRHLGLERYVAAFEKLRRDPAQPWPEAALGRAPYKPLLLLSVIDLIAEGSVTENLIRLDPTLCDTFNDYWALVMPAERTNNIAMPFYHLRSEGFWHLESCPGSEARVQNGISKPSAGTLQQHVQGARLDDELFLLLTIAEPREVLRSTLIRSHFAPEVHEELMMQGFINTEAYRYSRILLEQALHGRQAKEPVVGVPASEPIRDQGFRRAVVTAYNHRCALCGISIRTPDHHTAVDAAHIVPWSISRNDDPRNGMALCKLCHWTFDAGLVSVSEKHTVILSRQLLADYNYPGHLSTLKGRSIVGPDQHSLWPDLSALAWHRKHKLL